MLFNILKRILRDFSMWPMCLKKKSRKKTSRQSGKNITFKIIINKKTRQKNHTLFGRQALLIIH